jgi:formiminoglutamase
MPLILMLIPTFILEGRHSGNGFSYAYEEGFLKNILFLDYMKTIPQKCFRPYQKKRMIVYVTIHTTASVSERKKEFSQEMAGA